MRIVATDRIHQNSAVLHIFCDRTDLIQRGGKGYESISGHPAISGLQSDHTTTGSGLANRASRIGSQSADALVSGHRGCRTTAGASWNPLKAPGIVSGLESCVLGG